MTVEMKKYKLGDIAKIYDGPHATPKKIDQGPIYLGINAVTEDCRIDPNGLAFLSEEDYKVWTKRVTPQHKDIVFSYEATLGRYAIIPENFYGCLGRRLGIVRVVDSKVNYEWLFYYFQSPQWKSFIKNHTIKGSTVDRISVEEMPNYEIPAIDINKQNRIALVLSTLDKRIENLRAQNRVLEQTAKTIYDYTFLQCAGHQTTYNKILNRNIPINWEVCSIGDYVKDTKGGDWGKEEPKKNYNLQVSCIRGADIDKMTNLPIRYILAKNTSKLLQEFDLVVEISGGSPTQSTGRSRLITKELLEKFDNKLICSNFCQAVTMKNPLYAYYFCFMWKMFYDNGTFFNFEGKTSGIKNFQLDQFLDTMWFFPDLQTVKNFNAQVSPLIQKQLLNAKQIETLTTQRNTLLPLLMTSQIEV